VYVNNLCWAILYPVHILRVLSFGMAVTSQPSGLSVLIKMMIKRVQIVKHVHWWHYKFAMRARFWFSLMCYGVWKVEIEGWEGWLVRVIIILTDIYDYRNVCLPLACSSFMFSLVNRSLCSEYDARYFYGHPCLFTTC